MLALIPAENTDDLAFLILDLRILQDCKNDRKEKNHSKITFEKLDIGSKMGIGCSKTSNLRNILVCIMNTKDMREREMIF